MAGTNRLYSAFVKRLGTTPSASEDDLIDSILSDSEDAVLDMIGRDVLPERLDSAVVELAVTAYNKVGAEGEASRSEGGIARAFDDLPPVIRARIENYPRKVGVIRAADET
jgi:hypothetical protein